MIYKRIISLFLVLICLSFTAVTCFYAVEEAAQEEVAAVEETPENVAEAVEETVEEIVEEPTEPPTEEPTEKPTQAPTEPPTPSPALLGYAGYAQKLDETVYKDSDLGAVYHKDHTTFKVWAPYADDVKVCIYKTGSDDEEGFNTIAVKSMKLSKTVGTWYVTLDGDFKNMYYTYKVTYNGQSNEVVDPYAKAVGVNGNRGMIVNLKDTDPEGWSEDSFKLVDKASDAVVWEVNVRDFSADDASGVSEVNRGKFLAFTESGTTYAGKEENLPTCLDYLKELGVNYVQINPFYDFASIDETEPIDYQYNWGYDPKNYNVPEGSYSSDPYNGKVRITECKKMIQALHKAGIGVIMDVVYNHTYYSEDSFFNQLVPYYYHRFEEDGTWSNGSGCGNDVATERYMVRKFIRESVKYWAQEYHIDGFRFDLMGLMDVDTMNGIRSDLNKLTDGDKIIMYGEAWNLKTAVSSDVKLANQDNMSLLKGIAAFNDTGRDAIKGSNFNAKEKGFVQSGSSKSGVRGTIEAEGSGWAKDPEQCVNYVSCHDNLTLYDKLTASVYGDDEYSKRRENLVSMNKLAAAIVLTSKGMLFMLAGEEMGRTKQGDENSYISSIEINKIDWKSRYVYNSLTEYYKGLIQIRKAVSTLRKAGKIEYLDTEVKDAIAYTVSGKDAPSAVVAFNGDTGRTTRVTLPSGKWTLVADGDTAGLRAISSVSGSILIPPHSAAVLIDSESFEKIGKEEPECVVYVRYRDQEDDTVVCEECLKGKMGDKYTAVSPSDVLYNYNIRSKSGLTGTLSKANDVVNIKCEYYNGGYSTVTIRYMDENDKLLANTVVMTNRIGQGYYTPSIPGVKGYSLDLDDLPENAAGKYTEEPIEVIFRYKKTEDKKAEGDYTCPANVIYLADDGSILDIKTYMGVEGDALEIEDLEFEGYEYFEESNSNALFTPTEVNVIVYYHAPQSKAYLIYIAIGAAALIGLAVLVIILASGKKKKMRDISID